MKNLQTITFEELKESFGLGVAVVLYEKDLPKDFYKELAFGDWEKVYQCSMDGNLKDNAAERMLELADGLEKYGRLYRLAPEGSELQEAARKLISGI